MSTEKGQRSCLNRCPLDKLTSSEARTNRKDQSAVRTGRIGPCVADIGIDVGHAQSHHPLAGLPASGPVPVFAALRTAERGEAAARVSDMTFELERRSRTRSKTGRVGKNGVSKC